MKNLALLLLFLPIIGVAQYDFDTRYFTIDTESLPETPEITSFSIDAAPKLSGKLASFKLTQDNYWQPVAMKDALDASNRFVNTNIEITPIIAKRFGFTNYDNETGENTTVKNIAYKEMKGLDLLNSCPPVGICSRCAPYRLGRGY